MGGGWPFARRRRRTCRKAGALRPPGTHVSVSGIAGDSGLIGVGFFGAWSSAALECSVGGGGDNVSLNLFAEVAVVAHEVDEGADDGADSGAVVEGCDSECFVAFGVEGHAEGRWFGFIHDGSLLPEP